MNLQTRDRGMGALAVALCALLWSTSGLLIKLVDWNPFHIAMGRSLVSAVFLWTWIKKPRFTFSFAQIGAAASSAITMILFVYANKKTSAANAILLQYGAPIYTAILSSIVLKEKPKPEHMLAFAAVACGMAVFFMEDLGGGSLTGNLAASLAGVSFGVYFVFMRMQKDESPLESNLLGHIITVLLGLFFVAGSPLPGFKLKAVSSILALGIFQTGFSSILLAWGIKRVNAIQGVIITGLEPVFNPVWVFLFLGEKPGRHAFLGGLIIMGAVLASSLFSAFKQRNS